MDLLTQRAKFLLYHSGFCIRKNIFNNNDINITNNLTKINIEDRLKTIKNQKLWVENNYKLTEIYSSTKILKWHRDANTIFNFKSWFSLNKPLLYIMIFPTKINSNVNLNIIKTTTSTDIKSGTHHLNFSKFLN